MNDYRRKDGDFPGGKVRLIYILAASHSGSTLLAMLLGSHPEVCTAGELKLTSLGTIERYRCSCGKKIRECEFWKKIAREMHQKGFDFDIANAGTDLCSGAGEYIKGLLSPLHRGPVLEGIRDLALNLHPEWRGHLKQVQERNVGLVEAIRSAAGKRIVVDSSKIGIRLKYLLRNKSLDVRVIRLIRDGRAVALTYMDPARFADAGDPNLRGGGMGGDRKGECLTMEEAAREWRRSNEEGENIVRRLDPSRWLEVRYEGLCTGTNETLRRVFNFIGVDPAFRPPNFRAVENHVVGNGMRLDSKSEIVLDERWRSVLSESDLKVFDSTAGDKNRQYGYK